MDVGCGTGHVTEVIWKAGILKNPILCVDASAGMLENVHRREFEGLEAMQAKAQDFFSDPTKFRQNKVMMIVYAFTTSPIYRRCLLPCSRTAQIISHVS